MGRITDGGLFLVRPGKVERHKRSEQEKENDSPIFKKSS
jgi:hypothetical protein